ncbi:EthD family reductase [Flavobacterium phycosphaerae]|uniref:EthD family reductase n=1 Tax=Flavobacterium phycosphaerae TaxID=2697515 RepID=UPI001389BFEB|nr:EthD family reductase [Flavobacterium phycosphaerae]
MVKMTVIYNIPKDVAFFEKHYFETHVPLAKQLPGLIKYEINDGQIISTTGHTEIHRVANLYFNSMEEMMNAFQSEIGKQCAADRKILASNEEVQIYLYNTKEI